MLSIVIVLSAVPAMAADNTVKLTGEGICALPAKMDTKKLQKTK